MRRRALAQDARGFTEREVLRMRYGQRVVLLRGTRVLSRCGGIERAALRRTRIAKARRACRGRASPARWPKLRPESPTLTFVAKDKDDFVSLEQKFEAEKATVVKSRGPVRPGPTRI